MEYSVNIKIKLGLLVVLIHSAAFPTLAQRFARDYFLPAPKKNKVTFNMPDTNGKKSEFTRVMYYLKNGDQYDIIDTIRYHGKTISTEKRTVEFMPDEVRMVKLISTTDAEPNKTTLYEPSKVIMKVPGIGQTLTWSYNEAHGQKTNFIAEWIKFKLNNVNTRAIRITETITLPIGLPFEAKRVSYYMKDIGLWKMEGETRFLQQTICEFVKLEYDSIIQK